MARKNKILFLAANPYETAMINVRKEFVDIQNTLLTTKHRSKFEINADHATTAEDLDALFERIKPTIVHFSAHGTNNGSIVLHDSHGNGEDITHEILSGIFRIWGASVKLVILNACYSEKQAKAIAKYVDCVIGMPREIFDDDAIRFATKFYYSLGSGKDVFTAHRAGVLELRRLGVTKECLPRIKRRRGTDPSQLNFVSMVSDKKTVLTKGGVQPNVNHIPAVYADIVPGALYKSNDAYSPNPLRIPAGTTVVWTNNDTTIHTVTSGNPTDGPDGQFGGTTDNPTLIFANGKFQYTFETEGEFMYYCTLHPQMMGKVIVSSKSSRVPKITVATDKSSYVLGETIRISGNIGVAPTGQPLLMQVYNPNDAAYRFDQVNVEADGSYTYTFRIGGNLGVSGTYDVRVSYGGVTRNITFDFNNLGTYAWMTTTLLINGKFRYPVPYLITGGSLRSLTGDSETATITAVITANNTGQLKLRLLRNVFDSFDNKGDTLDFIVFLDEIETVADDDFGRVARTLSIDFKSNTERIDIVGTMLRKS